MYSLIIYLYQFGVFVMSFFSEKVRKMWRGERASYKILKEKADPNVKYLWFHAASLGEFEQARPIIEKIKKETPEEKILLTFFSPSGYEVRKDYEYADIVCYLPIDTPSNAVRFLHLINIKKAYFIKYEFWWNFLRMLRRQKAETYSVSSIFRPDQIFFKWYNMKYHLVLKCFTHFFVQNETSKQLLASRGVTETTIIGDTRFDRVKQIKDQAKVLPIVEEFVGDCKNVFVAGSSWQPDEDIFLKYFSQHKDWKLIIAPHVIGESHLKEIESKLQGCGMSWQYYVPKDSETTQNTKPQTPNPPQVLIINCFGLLSSIYRYGNAAYIGGGFGVGIHNTLEAAVWGMPVIFGPNNKKFQEAQELKSDNGGYEISNYDDFATLMDKFINEPKLIETAGNKATTYMDNKCGATDIVVKLTLDQNLPN